MLDIPLNEMLLVASAAGAFLVYALDRGWGGAEDRVNHPEREEWWLARGHAKWAGLAALAGVGLWAGWQLPGKVLACGMGLGLIGVAYAGPWGTWSLKWRSGRARFLLIAAVWGAAVVVLPLVSTGAPSGPGSGAAWSSMVLLAAYRTAWLIPNTLAAEFHGREGDRSAGMANVTLGWSRAVLTRWVWATVLLAAVIVAALLATLPASVHGILILDTVGLLAMGVYIGRVQKITETVIVALDLMALWPLVPALLAGAN